MKTTSIIALIVASAVVFSLLVVTPIALALSGSLDQATLFGLASLVLSWPVAALILGLLFMTRFHQSLDTFLRNIAHMKLPGGVEFQSQPQPPPDAESTVEDTPVSLSEEDKKQVEYLRSKIGELQELSQAERELLSRQYAAALAAASWWKFSYLNLFLVPQTKQVLLWFSQNAPQTRSTYSTLWAPFIQNEQQRTLTLDVLIQNGLLEEDNDMIRLTPEGYAFLQFMGAIPYPPIPARPQSA